MRSFIVLAQGGSSRGKERKIDYEEKRVWDGLKEKSWLQYGMAQEGFRTRCL